jgi:uncharacterized heparinase superfamily protein
MGLVFAGLLFRNRNDGAAWLKRGILLLNQECCHQILDDGGPAEQSFSYHRLVLDLYWLTIEVLELNGLHDCSECKERLSEGERFLKAFELTPGTFPAIGDSDDGHAIAPGISPKRYKPPDILERYSVFPVSGYTAVRSAGGVLSFDHGPLGMPPLYNHGHADALSVTLSLAGREFLVDTGTFRYNGSPCFRRYFKSTRAHNTVTIDNCDQAIQDTGFIWSKPYAAILKHHEEVSGALHLEAGHDGYCRLSKPVHHIRSILNDPDDYWLIADYFQGKGQHIFELNFHFHPEVALTEMTGGWLAERDGRSIRIELTNGDFNLRRGEEEPPLGWYSPAYNVKMPTTVLQAVRTGLPAEVRFETRISIV